MAFAEGRKAASCGRTALSERASRNDEDRRRDDEDSRNYTTVQRAAFETTAGCVHETRGTTKRGKKLVVDATVAD